MPNLIILLIVLSMDIMDGVLFILICYVANVQKAYLFISVPFLCGLKHFCRCDGKLRAIFLTVYDISSTQLNTNN